MQGYSAIRICFTESRCPSADTAARGNTRSYHPTLPRVFTAHPRNFYGTLALQQSGLNIYKRAGVEGRLCGELTERTQHHEKQVVV